MTIRQVTPARFIPFRVADIIAMCNQQTTLAVSADEFQQFTQLLQQVFHIEFKHELDALKQSYAGLDPDADTRTVFAAQDADSDQFVQQLKQVLNKANFEAISREELDQAMSKSSLFDLRLSVDFDRFSEVLLFCRGSSVRQETIKIWYGLRKKHIEFINYDRVVVYVRFKPSDEGAAVAGDGVRPGSTLLKLFRNVPRADLEMLFPETEPRMRIQDKLLIGIPAVVSGGIVLTTKMGATLLLLSSMLGFWFGVKKEPVELNLANLTILFAGLGALGAYFWQQFSKFKNRKLLFMQQLTQNLYFKNLDNNAGVIYRLLNDAEEEEVKEALLAYFFLCQMERATQQQLDEKIEAWLADQWQCTMDFEIDDALAKLLRLELIHQQRTNESEVVYSAVPLAAAIGKLKSQWQAFSG